MRSVACSVENLKGNEQRPQHIRAMGLLLYYNEQDVHLRPGIDQDLEKKAGGARERDLERRKQRARTHQLLGFVHVSRRQLFLRLDDALNSLSALPVLEKQS